MNTHLRPQPAPLSAPPRAVPGRPGLAAADPGRVTRGLLLTQIPSVDWRIISRCNLACGFGYGLEPTRDPVRCAPGGTAERFRNSPNPAAWKPAASAAFVISLVSKVQVGST